MEREGERRGVGLSGWLEAATTAETNLGERERADSPIPLFRGEMKIQDSPLTVTPVTVTHCNYIDNFLALKGMSYTMKCQKE